MDEITLDNKTYVSSKRAAKITGYAKDYVGQLCREGRVEARLVGRNWYVLESSIREHRFGSETSSSKNEPEIVESIPSAAETPSPLTNWAAPQYTSEPPHELPTLSAPASVPLVEYNPVAIAVTHEVVVPAAAPVNEDVVKEMQSAWHDWFSRTNELEVSEETLLEAPETEQYLTAGVENNEEPELAPVEEEDEKEEVVTVSAFRKPVGAFTSQYDDSESSFDAVTTPITLEKVTEVIEERESEHMSATDDEEYEERVPIKRSYKAPEPAAPATFRTPTLVRQPHAQSVSSITARTEGKIISERVVRKAGHKQTPSLALSALFISIAVLAILIAVVGTGKLDTLFSREHLNYSPINYLGGQSSFKKAN